MSEKWNVVVCSSGGGGNFQSIIDHSEELDIEISLLIVSRHCGAIERAKKKSIDYVILDQGQGSVAMFKQFDEAIDPNTDLIVLAGFMPIIPSFLCQKWEGKMINTHPSLLPKYGGEGMYGVKVQEAVMAAKEKVAGCSVHFVTEEVDAGNIIIQKSVTIDYQQSPWHLGGKIFKEECKLLVKAIKILKSVK